ncbi:MAG: pyridoxal phosphate-dependent class II aminotransferase [Tannerella sp.]|jgi:threonine-phosphate decarboxylase|nr:pyridoxal phosphate-dependent class II aminotransferase [Tannerella sp.]
MLNGHGDDMYRYDRKIVSNFSSNVYNQGDLSGLKSFLKEQLDSISSYPHPEAGSLQHKIASKNAISPANVCVTNGSTESVYLIAQTFRHKRSGILMPAFSEYADACRIHNHQTAYIRRLEKLQPFDIIWLCNPNNPTGEVYDKAHLTAQVNRSPKVLFVIDQAYGSFTEKPLFSPDESAAMPNMIILHSLTKQYAIPGLRLGYMTAHKNWISRLRMQRMPWSVNSLAIAAGHYLLDNRENAPDLTAYLTEKDRLCKALQTNRELEVFPSDTHFMLIRLCRGKAADLKAFLVNEYGILIRDASNFYGLNDSFIRIAAQTFAENQVLIHAVKTWFTTF